MCRPSPCCGRGCCTATPRAPAPRTQVGHRGRGHVVEDKGEVRSWVMPVVLGQPHQHREALPGRGSGSRVITEGRCQQGCPESFPNLFSSAD